jgi:hypothetical protein
MGLYYFFIKNMNDQVEISITVDKDSIVEFLRRLASAIKKEGEKCTLVETAQGCAEIRWP